MDLAVQRPRQLFTAKCRMGCRSLGRQKSWVVIRDTRPTGTLGGSERHAVPRAGVDGKPTKGQGIHLTEATNWILREHSQPRVTV